MLRFGNYYCKEKGMRQFFSTLKGSAVLSGMLWFLLMVGFYVVNTRNITVTSMLRYLLIYSLGGIAFGVLMYFLSTRKNEQ